MLFTEWNMDDAIAVAREEASEDGRKERLTQADPTQAEFLFYAF